MEGRNWARARVMRGIGWLARMDTAIGLLGLCALASLLGTVVPQGLPVQDYVPAWGPLGAKLLVASGLTDVFRAWWFLAVLGVLLLSVSSCVVRNGPQIYRQWFTPKAPPPNLTRQVVLPGTVGVADLRTRGWRPIVTYPDGVILWEQGPWLGRLGGRLNRVGYGLVHVGVLAVAVAGLLTGLLGWRGNLNLREGETDRTVLVWRGTTPTPIQLPFGVTNHAFTIEHFPSGMPSKYMTELTFVAKGQPDYATTVEVNHPATFGAYTFYQASFGDGGTVFSNLIGLDVKDGRSVIIPSARVYEKPVLADGTRVELLDFRPHTVESLGHDGRLGAVRDVGASLDYLVQPPAAPARQLRAFVNHPDWLGVADGQHVGGAADGQVIYRPVWLGLRLDDPTFWPVVAKLQARPEDFQALMAPLLARIPTPEARVATGLAVLRASAVLQELELTHLLQPTDFMLQRYSGLMVAHDPGAVLFWPAAGMLLLGVLLMLGRRLVRIWQVPGGAFSVTSAHGRGVAEDAVQGLLEKTEL